MYVPLSGAHYDEGCANLVGLRPGARITLDAAFVIIFGGYRAPNFRLRL